MYRITEELADYLMKHVKNPGIGELDINIQNPFLPKSSHSIGLIDPLSAIGTDLDYCLEVSYAVFYEISPLPNILKGYWLYRHGELSLPTELVEIPRRLVDPNIPNDSDDVVDITDCCVAMPSDIEKLTCPLIDSLEKLLAKEPLLLDCLDLNGEKK